MLPQLINIPQLRICKQQIRKKIVLYHNKDKLKICRAYRVTSHRNNFLSKSIYTHTQETYSKRLAQCGIYKRTKSRQ